MATAVEPLMIAGLSAMLATAADVQEVDSAKINAALGRKPAVTDDALKLPRGLRAAIDKTASKTN